MPDRNLLPISDEMPFETAALTEPLAVSYHGVMLAAQKHPRPIAALRTAVLGGGAIGVGAAFALRAFGCREPVILEPNAGSCLGAQVTRRHRDCGVGCRSGEKFIRGRH